MRKPETTKNTSTPKNPPLNHRNRPRSRAWRWYSITAITATPGETLRVVLVSTSTMPKLAMAHNFVLLARGTDAAALVKAGRNSRDTDFIPAAQKDKVLAMTALAGPDEKVEVTFTVPAQKGKYEFICTFPGHYTLNMKGVLTVQ